MPKVVGLVLLRSRCFASLVTHKMFWATVHLWSIGFSVIHSMNLDDTILRFGDQPLLLTFLRIPDTVVYHVSGI